MKKLDFEKVELLALKRGWGISVLQEKAGLANRTLFRIREGKNNASASTIYKVSCALGCDVEELLKA